MHNRGRNRRPGRGLSEKTKPKNRQTSANVESPSHTEILTQPNNLAFEPFYHVTICGVTFVRPAMGRFQAGPDCVAVAADRLVVIVGVDHDGGVVVGDLANGQVHTISAADLSAPLKAAGPREVSPSAVVDASDFQWEQARCREEAIASIDCAAHVTGQAVRVAADLGVSRRMVFDGSRFTVKHRRSHRYFLALLVPQWVVTVLTNAWST